MADATETSDGGLTDVAGIEVGHFTDAAASDRMHGDPHEGRGGLRGGRARRCAGTRETDLLDPVNTVQEVHAVVLSGGSAFGLDSATGVMRLLEERGIGFPVGAAKVPIVPAADPLRPRRRGLDDPTGRDRRVRGGASGGRRGRWPRDVSAPARGATVGKLLGLITCDEGRPRRGGDSLCPGAARWPPWWR